MARAPRDSQSVVLRVAALLTSLALPGCSAPSVASPARISTNRPTERDISNECTTVKDLFSLAHLRRVPYSDFLLRNDKVVQELASLLPPGEALTRVVADVLAHKRANGTYGEANLGFGAIRASKSIPGGHVWCRVSAVLFHNEFASVDARCSWRPAGKLSECIAERYRAIFAQLGMTTTQDEAEMRTDYPDILAEMHQARIEALGVATDIKQTTGSNGHNTPQEEVAAERYLSDPLIQFRVGSIPGRGSPSNPGQPSPGYTAAKTLVDAHALDALRRVLRGPNPEGRGFAAIGLSALNALSHEDVQVIDKLRDASTIATQYGCMVTIVSAQDFFSALGSFHDMFEPS